MIEAYGVAGGGGLVARHREDSVVSLAALAPESVPAAVLLATSLNPLLALGPKALTALEEEVAAALTAGRAPLTPLADVTLGCPVAPRDYVDFFSSEVHAANLGRLLRPAGDALLPNWRHLPVAYHGHASSVVASGTPVRRPRGQTGPGAFGPTAALDFEAELAWVAGPDRPAGEPPLTPAEAEERIFGFLLLNDWSARDLQRWESAPLGPFLGKSFLTSVSPWVVPRAALAARAVDPPPRAEPPAPYLTAGPPTRGLDIALEVELNGEPLARMSTRGLAWTPAQMLTHALAGGAALTAGDLFASGTVSEAGEGAQGCLAELWRGERWLADGDEVVIRAPGFGAVAGRVEPPA